MGTILKTEHHLKGKIKLHGKNTITKQHVKIRNTTDALGRIKVPFVVRCNLMKEVSQPLLDIPSLVDKLKK